MELIDLFRYVTLWKLVESYLNVVFYSLIFKKLFYLLVQVHTRYFFRRCFESMTRNNGAIALPKY